MTRPQAKWAITLAMVWIGIMAFASTPEWIRTARDFMTSRTGGQPATSKGGGGGGEVQP